MLISDERDKEGLFALMIAGERELLSLITWSADQELNLTLIGDIELSHAALSTRAPWRGGREAILGSRVLRFQLKFDPDRSRIKLKVDHPP